MQNFNIMIPLTFSMNREHDGRFRVRINYLLILIAITYTWIVLDSLYNITSIYNLSNNLWVMDSVTFVQSMNSAIFSHLPFLNNIPGGSFFGVHASPILYVLLPFYSISSGFGILYIIQAIILYSPAIALYLIARKKFGNDLNAFLIAFSYLFSIAIFTSTFEVLSLFAGFFIFAYYFYSEKKIVPFFLFFLLSLSTMEFAPILGGMFGLVLIIEKLKKKEIKILFLERNYRILKNYLFGVILIVISVAFFLMDSQMIAYFSSSTHAIIQGLYGTNPFSASSIIQGLMTNTGSKIGYIVNINYPYLFISFLDPIALMQIPWYLAIWISVFPYFSAYYESYTFPFVVIGAISGLSRIGKLTINKKLLIRIFTLLILIAMVVSWIASPTFSMPSPVSQSGLGAMQVVSVIPANASVCSDIYSYPIVSSQAWNTTTSGTPRNYTVFSADNGPPCSLNGYGLYAASGTYLAYEKNFISPPIINNFYYESTTKTLSVVGAPSSYYVSLYLPKGNFEVSANLVQKSALGIETLNSGTSVMQFMPVTEEAIQEFTVNKTTYADYIIIDIQSNYGYYGFSAKLMTTMNPNSTPIASTSFYNYATNVNYIQLEGPFTLNPGITYYLWVGTYGYPGGISIPIAHGSGLYEMNTTTSVINKMNNSMQFSIVGKIPGYVPKPTLIIFNYLSGNVSVIKSIDLTSKGYYFTVNVTSDGNFSTLSFLTSFAYGSFMISPLIIKAPNAVPPHNYYLQNINITIALALIPFYVLIGLAFFDSSPVLDRKRIKKYLLGILLFIVSAFVIFYVIFTLGYYSIFPSFYNVSIFAIFGYIITAGLLVYLILLYLSREKRENE